MNVIAGQKVSAAWEAWKASPDAHGCFESPTESPYLDNRLLRAFLAGVQFAEKELADSDTPPPRKAK